MDKSFNPAMLLIQQYIELLKLSDAMLACIEDTAQWESLRKQRLKNGRLMCSFLSSIENNLIKAYESCSEDDSRSVINIINSLEQHIHLADEDSKKIIQETLKSLRSDVLPGLGKMEANSVAAISKEYTTYKQAVDKVL